MFQKRSTFGNVNGILRENNADASNLNGSTGGGISESKPNAAWWEGAARSSLSNGSSNSKASAACCEGAARPALSRSSNNGVGVSSRAWPPHSDASAAAAYSLKTKTKSTLTESGGVSSATVTTAIGSTNMGLTTPPLQLHTKKFSDKMEDKVKNASCVQHSNGSWNGNEWDPGQNGNGNGDEEEADTSSGSEYDYGPGIVNRLKAKFITLSLSAKPVRRVASLEHLLDVEDQEFRGGLVDRTKFFYEQNHVTSNAMRAKGYSKFASNGSLKRARSMDNVMGVDRNYFNTQNNLRNAFLRSKEIIIIEQPKPFADSVVSSATEKKNNAANGRRTASPSCLIDELPMPNKVKECMKLFEHADENKNILPSAGIKPKILPKARAAAIFAEKEQVKAEIAAPQPLIINNDACSIVSNAETEAVNAKSSVKSRIDAFASKLSKSQPPANTCANTSEPKTLDPVLVKPIVPVSPVQRDTVISEEKRDPPPKIVDHVPATNGVNGVKLRTCQPHESINSVLIRFDDDKPRPHLPNINRKFNRNEFGNGNFDGNDEVDYSDGDDDVYDASDAASFSFVGANVVVGKSAILKTRNKKLQLIFDDKAVSTYEYLSESAVMSDDENDATSCDINGTHSDPNHERHTNKLNNSISGGLGNYTPLAVSDDQVFELGISRAPESTTNVIASNLSPPATQNEVDNDDSALSLKPAAEEDNVLWSCTQTSDILF